MSREIKIRAFDGYLMHQPHITINDEGFEIHGHTTHARKLALSESTGLSDQHGKEIYEGDILNNFGIMREVRYGGGRFYGLASVELNDGELFADLDLIPAVTQFTAVVGNIYQNPELLKKSAA